MFDPNSRQLREVHNPATAGIEPVVVTGARRFGIFPARIGTDQYHKLTAGLTLQSGRYLAPGSVIHLNVKDLDRHPAVAATAKWHCRNERCVKRKESVFDSKEELLAAHDSDRDIVEAKETHMYIAVADIPGAPHRPERVNDDGSIISLEVLGTKPTIMLLSDEF